jgi:hypothetical protein
MALGGFTKLLLFRRFNPQVECSLLDKFFSWLGNPSSVKDFHDKHSLKRLHLLFSVSDG